jgi:hypothetical protein
MVERVFTDCSPADDFEFHLAQVTRRMPFENVQWPSSVSVIESHEVLPSQQWAGKVENA